MAKQSVEQFIAGAVATAFVGMLVVGVGSALLKRSVRR